MHEDDFTITGPDADVEQARLLISNTFEVQTQQIRPQDVGEEMLVLKRRFLVTDQGYRWEPDSKHAIRVLKELGLEIGQSKGSAVTGIRENVDTGK